MSSSTFSPTPMMISNNNNNTHPLPPPTNPILHHPPQSSSSSSIEATYNSLVQQYLSLLQYDNAIFIAERFVAYNSTPYSNYLLAMCYYRCNKVQYAKRILMNWDQKGYSSNSTHRNVHNMQNEQQQQQQQYRNNNIDDNIIYLLAKCNIDLKLWKEAEDTLLKNARMEYQSYKKKMKEQRNKEKKNDVSGSRNSSKNNSIPVNTLEEYLMELVSNNITAKDTNARTNINDEEDGMKMEKEMENNDSSSRLLLRHNGGGCGNYFPIPNGAAGLHLLGVVCQRTMRKEKAAIYYTLALKLDPMMWTSYEALCEMGVAAINTTSTTNINTNLQTTTADKPELDPINIFGVIPSNLYNIPKSQGGYGPEHIRPNHQYNEESKDFVMDGSENQEFLKRIREMNDGTQSPFNIQNASPIMTTGDEGERAATRNASNHLSFVPQTPYIRSKMHLVDSAVHETSLFPQTAMSTTNNSFAGRDGRRSSHLPPTALFATPGLTPIPHQHQSFNSSSYAATATKNDQVFSRAKQVASRLYYEPSPEMTPPPSHYARTVEKSRKNLNTVDFVNTPTPPRYASSTSEAARSNVSSSLKMSRRKQYKRRTDSLLAVVESNQEGDFGEQRLLFDGMCSVDACNPDDEDMDGGLDEEEEQLSDENERTKEESKQQEDNTVKNDDCNPEQHVEDEGVGEEGIQHILELFCTLGAAQQMLCSYRCKEAIQIFRSLPNNQYNTGFVQHQVGRAYFEIADYPSSQRALETMQRVEPHRMKGLELLSTVFWQLKKEVELSSLAQRVVDFDKMSPQSWCVVGNCFSLQKEHETALVFFRRSIQVDASFTYSHTLSGHEYVSNEDFDQAISCFRNAIRIDDRHYTAWYGLGDIYFRQEKYDLAEYHFKKALSINPQSSVLHCHLGMAQHANGRNQEALDTLACAFRVDPRNPQARFQRATIWMSIDKPMDALKELEKVRDEAPTEASVHFAMGKVLKRLDRKEDAMRCFLTALDLDPKDNNLIKAAIDRLDEPDMLEEDVSAF